MTFFGTQPTFTQVPPKRCDSITAALAPYSAARCAQARPPLPPPMTDEIEGLIRHCELHPEGRENPVIYCAAHNSRMRCYGDRSRRDPSLEPRLIVYFVGIYNGLVSLRENVKVAWANIDVLLKQRHDELPKLVETCKRYMQFEQETLEKVMRARASVSQASTSGNVAAVGAAEQQLRAGRRPAVRGGRELSAAEDRRNLQAIAGQDHRSGRVHRRPPRTLQRPGQSE